MNRYLHTRSAADGRMQLLDSSGSDLIESDPFGITTASDSYVSRTRTAREIEDVYAGMPIAGLPPTTRMPDAAGPAVNERPGVPSQNGTIIGPAAGYGAEQDTKGFVDYLPYVAAGGAALVVLWFLFK